MAFQMKCSIGEGQVGVFQSSYEVMFTRETIEVNEFSLPTPKSFQTAPSETPPIFQQNFAIREI